MSQVTRCNNVRNDDGSYSEDIGMPQAVDSGRIKAIGRTRFTPPVDASIVLYLKSVAGPALRR